MPDLVHSHLYEVTSRCTNAEKKIKRTSVTSALRSLESFPENRFKNAAINTISNSFVTGRSAYSYVCYCVNPGFGFTILALISNFISVHPLLRIKNPSSPGYPNTISVFLGNSLFCGGVLEFHVIWCEGIPGNFSHTHGIPSSLETSHPFYFHMIIERGPLEISWFCAPPCNQVILGENPPEF